jgi:WD40 repeat protein
MSWLNLQGNEEGVTRNGDAPMGITSLAFSPGDEYLLAHGQYTQDTFKFSRWRIKWDQGRMASIEKHPKDIESKDGPLFINSGNESIRFVIRSDRDGGEKGARRILVKVADGFVVINLDTLRAERRIKYEATQHGWPEYSLSHDSRWLITGQDNGMAYIWDTLKGTRYCVTIDEATEKQIPNRETRLKDILERPAHSGPILGVAFSQPDPGQDYPAFAATIGEENKIKVWELFPILDPDSGLRSRY